MNIPVSVIIVTHNSADVLPLCLKALDKQTRPVDRIIVVDSGSTDRMYLEALKNRINLLLIEKKNIGFAKANNIAIATIPLENGLIVFLNPDTFLREDCIASATQALDNHKHAGAVSGKLFGYDPGRDKPTGKLDSTGICRKWYGRWFDRGHGEIDAGNYDTPSEIPAICGALMCCRAEALFSLGSKAIFDEDFFLYKEDIELSLRLKKRGWQLIYDPSLQAYHCRGWLQNRQQVPLSLRTMAAKNEILLYKKHPSPYIVWAIMKYLLVNFLHI